MQIFILMILLLSINNKPCHSKSSQERSFVIVSTSRNNRNYYQQNLRSTLNQKHDNYRIIYVDDASTDDTQQLVTSYLQQHDTKKRVTFVKNSKRVGSMENFYTTITHLCKDHEIVVIVDGDDIITHNALEILNATYKNSDTWMTYGNYVTILPADRHFSKPLPSDIIARNAYRDHEACTLHLKTFYTWLFKKISKDDFCYRGSFYRYATDIAMMFPLLEMAGTHSQFIPDILYVYNNATPANEFKVDKKAVRACEKAIRTARRYKPLTEAPACHPKL